MDLVGRLEKSAGANRDLDRDIALSLGWRHQDAQFVGHQWISPAGAVTGLPFFTASIDAAMALVPDGMDFVVRSLRGQAEARVGGAKDEYVLKGGEHATPAMALCIAALKAREYAKSQKH